VIPADLSDASGASDLIDAAIAEYGRLDLLVNNAGGAAPPPIWKPPQSSSTPPSGSTSPRRSN
jgi:NAD(P)-dependent dehydrogenase (short-subunit alcohol dehydrogenase family)